MPPPSVTTAPATSSIPIDTSIEIEDEFLKDDSNSEAPGLVDKAESWQDDIPDIPDVVDSDDEDFAYMNQSPYAAKTKNSIHAKQVYYIFMRLLKKKISNVLGRWNTGRGPA